MGSAPMRDDEFINGFPFFGGRLWLDLLNTTMRSGEARRDLIANEDSFAQWLQAAGLHIDRAKSLSALKSEVHSFRETLRAAFEGLSMQHSLPGAVMAAINQRLDAGCAKLHLHQDMSGVRLQEIFDPGTAGPCGVIASDFARFVCNSESARLRRCSNPVCTMVFYDTSKNNTRRWCTMSICGNRDKVARFRARKSDSSH